MAIPTETERKYIILRPDIETLSREDSYTVSEIVQIYLRTVGGVTHRVRSRVYADRTVFTETKKTRISPMTVYEDEREISRDEFLEKSTQIDDGLRPVRKTRHTFACRGLTVEIDIYDEWKRCCILEVELPSEKTTPELPSFIKVIAEVTGDKRYSNHSMARCFPDEPI